MPSRIVDPDRGGCRLAIDRVAVEIQSYVGRADLQPIHRAVDKIIIQCRILSYGVSTLLPQRRFCTQAHWPS
jgi:hypothetical protein